MFNNSYAICASPTSPNLPRAQRWQIQAGDTYIRTRERPATVTAASPTRSAAAVPSNLAVCLMHLMLPQLHVTRGPPAAGAAATGG